LTLLLALLLGIQILGWRADGTPVAWDTLGAEEVTRLARMLHDSRSNLALSPGSSSTAEPSDTIGEIGGSSPPDRGTTTTTTLPPPPTTTTTRGWQPADECNNIPNPGPVYLTDATMNWCPMVAGHLARYHWNPGDLRHLMLLIECESNGDPNAINPTSGTSGLFQHRPVWWDGRSMQALGRIGDPFDPHDNIHVAVWLAKTQGFGHWDGCEPQIAGTLNA